jgi:hypothetical protein
VVAGNHPRHGAPEPRASTNASVPSARIARVASLLIGAALAGCRAEAPAGVPGTPRPAAASAPTIDGALAALRAFESGRRAATDFARDWSGDGAFGADPYRLIAAGDQRWLGVLRGSSALVVLDDELREQARAPAPWRPLGVALSGEGVALVGGELEPGLRRYRLEPQLEPLEPIEVPGVTGWSALAAGAEDRVYAVSESSRSLFVIEGASSPSPRVHEYGGLGHAPRALAYVPGYVVVNCLLDHALIAIPLDAAGRPRNASDELGADVVRMTHDGPFWGVALAKRDERLLIAASGVEDHPLDRSPGSFGYIDSFLYLYELDAPGRARRRFALNTSEHGVVTPKALTLSADDSGVRVHVTSYGSAAALDLALDHDFALARLTSQRAPPGSADVLETADGRRLGANPLLDAWTIERAGDVQLVPVGEPRDERAPSSKLGEALLYTTLMAPANRAEGALSRFTCEACHFEGYVDGRTHRTGRGDVVATTKPLFGLFNNRPHFSRALDRDLTQMVHNEFRVAGSNSGHDPWFSLSPAREPWLAALGVEREVAPDELRRALIEHLMRASHEPNPLVRGRHELEAQEARGAALFQSACESCHQARLDTSDAGSRVPFERWASLILSDAGPIVWGADVYARTGIEPYVHERGARVPSLRRLGRKFPYFTNGSAHSLSQVLERVRLAPAFSHAGGAGTALPPEAQRALEAFLRLL